eukprot:COSAG01_NODE_59291_length_301_cov_0.702970_1_plen_25_part_01
MLVRKPDEAFVYVVVLSQPVLNDVA